MKGRAMGRWLFLGPLASARRHSTLQQRIISHDRGAEPRSQRQTISAFNNVNALVKPQTKNTLTIMSAYRERRRRPTTSTNGSDVDVPSSTDEYTHQLLTHEQTARTKRHHQAKTRLEKATRRENRIYHLESTLQTLTDDERAELAGLIQGRENFEEQYSTDGFTEEHVEFKRLHNEAFVALARFCQQDRKRRRLSNTITAGDENDHVDEDPNVFYLDGPDAATSTTLIENHGFDPSCCYVANRHMSTYEILRQRLPKENVMHATAAEALSPKDDSTKSDNSSEDNDIIGTGSFSDVDFSAYYFDGCGGFTPHIIGMITAALIRPQQPISSSTGAQSTIKHSPKTTAVGYSLMGGNRDIVEKELDICRALSAVARTRGMRTRHVLDDPGRYGIPTEIGKTEGGTFTSWMLLEEDG